VISGGLSTSRFSPYLETMSILRIAILFALIAIWMTAHAQDDLDRALVPKSAEQKVTDAIKASDLTVVHLWAPWCSNCQAELKSGGWLKMVKSNRQVKFYFVSVWNDGGDGKTMLQKFQIADQPNVTVLAEPGPRRGDSKIKEFAGIPLSWIPTTWVYKGGDLRYALNYGEVRFEVLQQFLEDSKSEWSHKGEPKLPE
jgi:thiol-disulfide isomerase/thioredoxin